MSTTKGKQGTKGQKQIYEENQSTQKFYQIMTLATSIVHLGVQVSLFDATTANWICFVCSIFSQIGALMFMRRMARPLFNDRAQLVDAGLDINLEGAFGEYCKDVIILASIVQILTLLWTKFWFFMLTCPAFAVYKLWVGILAPWFFAPAPEEEESDEKRKKKKERKVKRI